MWTILVILGWIVGAIVGIALLYLLYMLVGTLYVNATGLHPKGVAVDIAAPPTGKVGQRCEILVRITDSLGRPRRLYSIDFTEPYIGGLTVESVSPKPAESSVAFGKSIYRMDQTIPAGGTLEVRFQCVAARAGNHRGECTVYVDSNSFRYIDTVVNTNITD